MDSPLNAVAQNVAATRYFRKDTNGKIIEDWDDLVKRVVSAVCSHESKEFQKEIYKLIHSTKFLPNSPCLVNAGNDVGGLLACFVTKSPEDSWVGMCENIANFGHVARRGGGCGVDFSQIRPSGSRVFGSTHYKACGPIHHMIVVSEAMNSITQAGFRGMANMGVLSVEHPDIASFIVCKQREFALKYMLREDFFGHFAKLSGKTHDHANVLLDKFVSNFNISVLATDTFMKAVESDGMFELKFGGEVYETIKAKTLFDLIVNNAWKNGDPGMLFYEAMNGGPYKHSGQKLTATNPCVAKGSLVATEHGWRPVEQIKVGDLIWSKNKLYPVDTIEVNDNCELYRVEFTDGDFIDVTAAHKFKCVVSKKFEYRRLDELCEGAKVSIESVPMYDDAEAPIFGNEHDCRILKEKGISTHFWMRDLGLIIGACIGDGSFTERINRYNVKVSFAKTETDWQEVFSALLDGYGLKNTLEEGDSCNIVYSNRLGWLLEICGVARNKAPDKVIPPSIMDSKSKKLMAGILDGLFSTDGNMYLKKDNPMLRFSNSSIELCKQIRRILLGFGIHAKIYKSERKPHSFNDPRYGIREIASDKPKFDIVIMNDGIAKFHEQIGLTNPSKAAKLKECVDSYHSVGCYWTSTIRSITKLEGLHTVYDLYNKETDEWNVNGYIQQGCGEQMLPQWGSCNLGSIDVFKFYDFNKNDLDWDSLKAAIRASFQFLDNVIDANKFPTKEFEEWAKNNRPVGLGIMGWADLLLALGIPYGSPESVEKASKIIKFFRDISHEKSVELAQEKGTPSACQHRTLDYRRNVTTLSIAPTGSISLLAGCSSSIEPIYAPVTYRADNTGHYKMPHPQAHKDYFRCALDKEQEGKREVKWQEHIAMQAAFQAHVDSGISKTINMPTSATKEDVAEAYMMAWKSGCKGVTIYRDGSKTTQVLSTEDAVNNTYYGSSHAKPRPKVVQCDIYKTTAEGMQWHIIVGLESGQPYEIFAVNGGFGDLPAKGQIVKKKKRHYCLLAENDEVLIENLNEAEEKVDPKLGLETRRFSLELRHGIPPRYIVEQIVKSSDKITSFSKAVGRILKKNYISSEELLTCEEKYCEKCAKNGKQTEMQPESGCLKCPECFHSRCG